MNLLMSYLLNGWKTTGWVESRGVRIPFVEIERREPYRKVIAAAPAEWADMVEQYEKERDR